jgi:DNA-directed RNA polymerase subunit RPC12/RpoP
MKYYCGNCGAEFSNILKADYTVCPLCKHKGLMREVPDFETPEQYAERTKEYWPDDGPVWFRLDERSGFADFVWGVCRYITAKKCGDKDIVCAQGPKPPPDNWRPE